MSYDLEFAAWPGSEEAARRTFLARLERLGWQRNPDDEGLLYSNEATGVTATLEEAERSEFETTRSLGLYLSLAYVRPSFWGTEVLPGVAQAAGAAGLRIADPQSKVAGDSGATIREAEDLVDSWTAGNEFAIASIGKSVPQMPRERAIYWWRYQGLKFALAAQLAGPDVFVPTLQPVRRKGSQEVLRQVAWVDGIPIVLPECEIVLLGRSRGETMEAVGVAAYAEVWAVVGKLLQPLHIAPNLDAEILWPDAARLVADRLLAMKLAPRAGLSSVPLDGFIDL